VRETNSPTLRCRRHVKTDPGVETEFDPAVRSPGSIPSQEEQKGMLSVEDLVEIRRLHRAEGLPIKMIARVLRISKNTERLRGLGSAAEI
jgi:hypothetical protein